MKYAAKMKKQKVEQTMLLDGKKVMDEAMPELHAIRDLIADKLHCELDVIIKLFEAKLAECDVSSRYKEIGKPK